MFSKEYDVDAAHVDFQGVVDGLYYPFYFEWARHAYMADVLGLEINAEFERGRMHILLSYHLQFKKSLTLGDKVRVTCQPQRHEKSNRINFYQQIFVGETLYAEATFVATCLVRGRPQIPAEVIPLLV